MAKTVIYNVEWKLYLRDKGDLSKFFHTKRDSHVNLFTSYDKACVYARDITSISHKLFSFMLEETNMYVEAIASIKSYSEREHKYTPEEYRAEDEGVLHSSIFGPRIMTHSDLMEFEFSDCDEKYLDINKYPENLHIAHKETRFSDFYKRVLHFSGFDYNNDVADFQKWFSFVRNDPREGVFYPSNLHNLVKYLHRPDFGTDHYLDHYAIVKSIRDSRGLY